MPGLAYTGEDESRKPVTELYHDYTTYMTNREEEERVKSYMAQVALVTTKQAAVLVSTEIQLNDGTWTQCETLLDSGALGSSFASQLWVQEYPQAIRDWREIE